MSEQLNDFDRMYERLLMLECPPTVEAEERVIRCHKKIMKLRDSDNCQECWKLALKGIMDLL